MKYLLILGYTFALIFHTNSALSQSIDKVEIAPVTTIKKEDELTDVARLPEFDRAIKQNPRDALAYMKRGFFKQFNNLNDASGALADYNKAVELNPEYIEAYVARASLKQSNLNDLSGALADYSKAIELNPKDGMNYYRRGLLKMQKIKDTTGAIGDFRQAASIFRDRQKFKQFQMTIFRLRQLGAIE